MNMEVTQYIHNQNKACSTTNEASKLVNYGSELEGTDVENSDIDDEKFYPRWPKLVRAVYMCSDDEEEYEEEMEEFSGGSGSEIDSSSGSEIDEDRLAKCVHRQAYSDSDDSYDEIDENSSPTNSPKDHKFDWKLLEITQNVTNTVSRNFQEKGKPGLKRHHSPTRNSKSNGKTQNNNDVSGNSKALQNLKLDKEEINSENRREKFSYNDIGPTKTYANPYEAFTAIWDNKIMEHIVKETNRYARQSNINQWQDTTVDEMYIYLGLVINTTIHVADVMKEYWFPFCEYLPMSDFPFLMSYERFKELTNCIHFNDNEKQSETINSQAKLYKLQPLIDLLNENFSVLYNVGQDIVLDEGLSQWRGWIVNTRAICEEPDPVDIKSVEICEPNTGYLWRVKFVTGDVTSEIIPGLVIQLLNGLEGKGHTLWLDKFYSSPILARKLKELGFDCAGLLKKSLLPTEVLERVKNITSNEEEKDGNFSEIFGSTSDDVDVFAWITKNRCMNFITTYHEVKTEITDVKSPKIMLDYNTIMQGVHRKDNLLFEFPMERKRAHVWYKMFFRKLLNASILNAHILYNRKDMKHHVFRKHLCEQIYNRHRFESPSPFPLEELHVPAQYSLINGRRIENKCFSCENMTEWYCYLCKFPLCETPCFTKFHTIPDSDDDCFDSDDSEHFIF